MIQDQVFWLTLSQFGKHTRTKKMVLGLREEWDYGTKINPESSTEDPAGSLVHTWVHTFKAINTMKLIVYL